YASIPLFLSGFDDHRALHPFPTRRSSDLTSAGISICPPPFRWAAPLKGWISIRTSSSRASSSAPIPMSKAAPSARDWKSICMDRSEEHTSELQSRENLVCRLLLEKKKQTP